MLQAFLALAFGICRIAALTDFGAKAAESNLFVILTPLRINGSSK